MLYQPLTICDPEVASLIELERERQFEGLELIASEVRKTPCDKTFTYLLTFNCRIILLSQLWKLMDQF